MIVVKQSSRGLSAKLLPPFLVVFLGAGVLAYRVSESNWHGLSWDRLAASWSWPSPKGAASHVGTDEDKTLALKAQGDAPAQVELPAAVADSKPEGDSESPEEDRTLAAPAPETDPLDDIKREAEKTKERIAELEKLKADENQKLAATENERREADRNQRLQKRGRRVAPNDIQRMLEAHQNQFRQQIAQMDVMRRQMFQRQRDVARQWGMDVPAEMPGPFGRAPGVPGPDIFMGIPGNGVTEFREFRGPGGSHGFVMRRQFRTRDGVPIDPKPGDVPPPPAPPEVEEKP